MKYMIAHHIRSVFGGRSVLYFDVGANVGQTVNSVLDELPKASVRAFEPIRASYEELVAGVEDHSSVVCERLALGAYEGEVSMKSSGTSTGNAIIQGPMPSHKVETVRLTTGDRYCDAHGIDEISYLKIDAEGHDLAVLLGFGGMLVRHRIGMLEVEVSMNPSNQRHVDFPPIKALLEQLGYLLFSLDEQVRENKGRRSDRPMALRRANAVFISRGLAMKASRREARRVANKRKASSPD